MTELVVAAAAMVAGTAAARSTWSPCGVSMLATITPLAERARGHRYRTTALWFVAGALAGGATLGLALALLALGVRAAGLGPGTVAVVAAAASLLAAASDAQLRGFRLPAHHRQVNERWLDGFRPWVYGTGFGWQIGTGLTTYIKTAAVYLTIVLAALTGRPSVALALGTLFGLVRGLAVLAGRGITTPAALSRFHRRLTAADPRARAVTVATELLAALVFAFAVSPWAAFAVALCAGAPAARRIWRRDPAGAAAPPARA